MCKDYVFMAHQQSCQICTLCDNSSSVETLKKLARIDRITTIFLNVREHVCKGNTYVMVVYASLPLSVYASPPLSGGDRKKKHMFTLDAATP